MKAKELSRLLLEHPDFDENFHFQKGMIIQDGV